MHILTTPSTTTATTTSATCTEYQTIISSTMTDQLWNRRRRRDFLVFLIELRTLCLSFHPTTD